MAVGNTKDEPGHSGAMVKGGSMTGGRPTYMSWAGLACVGLLTVGLYHATCRAANDVGANATLRTGLHVSDNGGFRPIWSAMAAVSSDGMSRTDAAHAGT